MSQELIITLIIIAAVLVVGLVFVLLILIRNSRIKNDSGLLTKKEENDIFLSKGSEYSVLNDSSFPPGKYIVSTDGIRDKYINIRVTGFIKEFKRNSNIQLNEGDKITALSENVILKRKEKK